MPTITTRPDLTRTRAALAAYDVIDAEITADMTQEEADDFFKRSDAAKLAIGEAFALDTTDCNEFEVARFLTLAFEAGVAVEDVSAALGHSSTATTKNTYLHNAVSPGARRANAAVNRRAA